MNEYTFVPLLVIRHTSRPTTLSNFVGLTTEKMSNYATKISLCQMVRYNYTNILFCLISIIYKFVLFLHLIPPNIFR